MKIRVAMIADVPDIPGRIDGGVQAVTTYLADAMSSYDEIELHILSFRSGEQSYQPIDRGSYVWHRLPLSKLGTLTGFAADQRTVDLCLESVQPDIVHSQGGGHHGILASRCRFPSVVTVHGIFTREASFIDNLQQKIRTRVQGWIADYYCIRNASNTILISPYVSQHYGASLAGVKHHIPNPVAPRFFDVERTDSSNRILFAGRLYALKGIRELLQAAARLDDIRDLQIVLAGEIEDDEYADELKQVARQLRIESQVAALGSLHIDDLLHELSICSCLVLPSFQETAPMVIQEAMAAGVPVVASNICGIPYQVEESKSGFLVRPGDVDALARALRTLLTDNGLRKSFGEFGRNRALEEYQASVVARKTIEVYRQILQ